MAQAEKKSPQANPLVLAINMFHMICWIHIFLGTLVYFSNLSLHFTNSVWLLNLLLVLVKITQTLQFTDTIFSIMGLTKGSIFGSFLQILGRNYIVWFVLSAEHSNLVLGLILFNWSFADTVRYYYYLKPSKFSLFLRYNAFLLNYPLGIAGELGSVQEIIWRLEGLVGQVYWIYFYRFSQICLFSGFAFLFNYMLNSRKSALRKIEKKKE